MKATLCADIPNIVRAYGALTFRGGIEGDVETQSDLANDLNIPDKVTIVETRKYVFHRMIERNGTAAKNANFTAPAAKPTIWSFPSVTVPSAKALLWRIIRGRLRRWMRGSRSLTMWRPTLRRSALTVTG